MFNMTSGLVTTIIPVFNRPAQLREAVQSVLTQGYRPIEVIIVDDGSTDETFAVAQSLERENDGIVRAVTKVNGGPGLAREHGRQLARGEFIQYLDSDDVLLPGKFSAQVGALRADAGAGVAYGITFVRDASGALHDVPHKATGESQSHMFPRMLVERWWETATPLYRACICALAGAWTNLSLEEDWEYDCRVAALGTRLAYCPVPVSEHRDHVGTRLSRGAQLNPIRNSQRARSHELVFEHASRAGLMGSSEMQRFARSLFLLARQCGAAGLPEEAKRLFALAQRASGEERARRADFRLYETAATVLGWTTVGRLCQWVDGVRR